MVKTMFLPSAPPHDFWLTLDCDGYFLKEHDPEEVYMHGYARVLSLAARDVLAVMKFNENPEEPGFEVTFPHDDLDDDGRNEAKAQITRMLGLDLDLRPLIEQAEDDPVLGPMLLDYYGFKRLKGANLYEDAFTDIITTRISHKPTAKRMDQDIRKTYGTAFEFAGTVHYGYPRPERLLDIDPETFREWGVSKRKGEYITGMARDIHEGTLDLEELEQMDSEKFYEEIQKVRGIGPSTAQTLMLARARPDAVFPPMEKKGEEKGMRRWIAYTYDRDPNELSEDEFQELIASWRGYECLAIKYLYYDWITREAEKEEG